MGRTARRLRERGWEPGLTNSRSGGQQVGAQHATTLQPEVTRCIVTPVAHVARSVFGDQHLTTHLRSASQLYLRISRRIPNVAPRAAGVAKGQYVSHYAPSPPESSSSGNSDSEDAAARRRRRAAAKADRERLQQEGECPAGQRVPWGSVPPVPPLRQKLS